MDDLAKKAFFAEDFELAAKLYKQLINEVGATSSLYLSLGDAYAKGNHIKEALNAYKFAFKLGEVRPDQLDHLITTFVSLMTYNGGTVVRSKSNKKCIFICDICKVLWQEPITIPCGHTFCRKCLEEKRVNVCKTCSYASKYDFSTLKCNVVLQNCIEKMFPNELEAVRLKRKGNDFLRKGNYKEAATVFEEAIKCDASNHFIVSSCSNAYCAVGDFEKALYYAQLAVELQPGWYEGYLCLGNALTGLKLESEAVLAFGRCLALNPTVSTAKKALAQCLHELLSSLAQNTSYKLPTECQIFNDVQRSGGHGRNVDIASILSELQCHNSGSCRKTCSEGIISKVKLILREDLLKANFSQLPGSYDENTKLMKVQHSSSSHSQLTSPLSMRSLWRSKSDSFLYLRSLTVPRNSHINYLCLDAHQSASKHLRLEHKIVSKQVANTDNNLTVEDFKCTLCYRLLYMPLTTPCGHMFCKQCLERSLDHSPNCPLCKSSLVQYIIERVRLVTVVIEQLIEEYFPTEAWQRKMQYENEIAELARMGQDDQHEIPVFVCILAFPAVSCPLHIFEPRYRLMIRQCLEAGTRQFGMCVCLESNEANFSSYGTMLEIHDVEYLPDGRSLLTTTGGQRFRVLSRGMRDGYHTAKVEFLSDIQVPDEEKTALWGLHNLVRHEAEEWFSHLLHIHHLRIVHRYGTFPDVEDDIFASPNGPSWCWWLIAVLPIDRHTQLMMLAMTSLKDRLLTIRRILASFRDSQPH